MITLKHLARDFNVDPYSLRMALRAAGLEPQVNKRWKWETTEEPSYKSAKVVAEALSHRIRSRAAAQENEP